MTKHATEKPNESRLKSKKNQKMTPNMQLKNTTLQLLWDA